MASRFGEKVSDEDAQAVAAHAAQNMSNQQLFDLRNQGGHTKAQQAALDAEFQRRSGR